MSRATKTLKSSRSYIHVAIGFVAFIAVSISSTDHKYLLDNGEEFNFDDAIGSWVVISYWAIWCAPCRDEIAILNSIHKERDKHNVIVLGVNFDEETGETLEAQKLRFNAQYPDLLEDPGPRWGESKPTFIPRTLIINQNGELANAISGKTSRREILKNILIEYPEPVLRN